MLKRSRGGDKGSTVENEGSSRVFSLVSEPGASPQRPIWPDIIPNQEWELYRQALDAARRSKIDFMVGGGFSLAFYTNRWRNTKDMDFYVLPAERQQMIDALGKAGFVDYYDQKAYDRGWIYRSHQKGVIVDVIWSMANRRAEVDPVWFERGPVVSLRDETFKILPPEELLWCKLYVLQRDHCDWTDLMNLIYGVGPKLDWDHLLSRVGNDVQLLKGILELFTWAAPHRAAELPMNLRRELQLSAPQPADVEETRRRVRLLDSRGWFAAFHPQDQPLEV